MLLAAAVCPHPPLLVPALTGAADGPPPTGPAAEAATAAAELRATCLAAVRDLLAAGDASDSGLDVVVVGTGPTPASEPTSRWAWPG